MLVVTMWKIDDKSNVEIIVMEMMKKYGKNMGGYHSDMIGFIEETACKYLQQSHQVEFMQTVPLIMCFLPILVSSSSRV
jgi:hypothetical protein